MGHQTPPAFHLDEILNALPGVISALIVPRPGAGGQYYHQTQGHQKETSQFSNEFRFEQTLQYAIKGKLLVVTLNLGNFIEEPVHLLIRECPFRYSHSSANIICMKEEVFLRLRPGFEGLPRSF